MDFDPSTATLDKPEFDPTTAKPDAPLRGAAALPTDPNAPPAPPPAAPAPQQMTSPNGKPLTNMLPPGLGGIAAAIQAGMNVVDSVASSIVGGVAAIPVSAASMVRQGVNKLRGQPVAGDEIVTPPQAQEKITGGVQTALQNMPGRVQQTPQAEAATDKLAPVMENLPAVAALHGTMGPAGAVRAAAEGVDRMGLGSAARNVTPLVRDSAKVAADDASANALRQPTDQVINDASKAGYKFTPGEAGAGAGMQIGESLAGSPKLKKGVSASNAETTNRLIREDVQLPDDQPITRDSLAGVRKKAGEAYSALKDAGDAGPMTADAQYHADLDAITKSHDTASESFAHRSENPFGNVIDGLRTDTISIPAAVEEVKLLRADSDKQFSTGDKGLGRSYRDAAAALDNLIDRHLSGLVDQGTLGPEFTGAVDKYRAARQLIAKTYSADRALNPATGDINAGKYGAMLDRKVPLSGNGLLVGRMAKAFPDLVQRVEKSRGPSGPTIADALLAALHGTKGVATGALTVGARPLGRAALKTQLAQDRITARARGNAKPEPEPTPPAPPPEDPTTSPGAGPGTPPPTPAGPGPLGDLTPMWSTSPGAGGEARAPGVEPTGLVPAVGEAHTPFAASGKRAGEQIPAVPGRPDLPDSMLTGLPRESAANDATNAAMLEPGAQEAMRRAKVTREDAARAEIPVGEATEVPAGTGVREPKTPKPGSIPVGKVTEGQPEIKTATPTKIPVGQATEVTPEVIELGRKWQREYNLGDDDAARAHATARAFDHDPEAVAKAADQFDHNPAAFDAEISRINAERTANEDAINRTARGGQGPAGGARQDASATNGAKAPVPQGAEAGSSGVAAAVRTDGDGAGSDGAAAAAAERGGADVAGRQAAVKKLKDDDGNSYAEVTLPSGKVMRLQRHDSTSTMGLPGWHDMDATDQHSYVADTLADATHALVDKDKPKAIVIREVPGGFEAYQGDQKVGYLKDNLERGQAKAFDENANIDIVKVDKAVQGTGVGRALYEAFHDKHDGRILPSGKTTPQAWAVWKRNFPHKVDKFVTSEAARIKDGADPKLVIGNITDPEIAQRVQTEAAK